MLLIGMTVIDHFRALPSLAMIGLVLVSVIFTKPKDILINIKSNKALLTLSLSFVIMLPSYFYSDNIMEYFDSLRIHIPYLILPFAFALLPKFSKKQFLTFYYLFMVLIFFAAAFAFAFYLHHTAEVNQLYLESKVMPTLVQHHPTFSLMLAFATFSAYHLYFKEEFYILHQAEKYFILFAGIFLFIFTHVFSVRVGLIALYAIMIVEVLMYIIKTKKVLKGIMTIGLCLIVGVGTLFFSPTFKNKLQNTTEDYEAYSKNGSANNKSLASRMISYKNALEITENSSWLIGCGIGDIKPLNLEIFAKKYPDISKPIIPHNQFLYVLASTGLIGLGFFLYSFYFPLFYRKNYTNDLLLIQYTLLSVAFMVEAFIETQLGVAFSILFILLPLNQLSSSIPEDLIKS